MRTRIAVSLVSFLLISQAPESQAQVNIGAHLSIAEDTDFGVGPRVLVDVNPNVSILGTFDWYFLDEDEFGDLNYYEIAGTALYRFPGAQVHPHAGGGLVVGHLSNGGSDSDTGFHLLGGATIGAESARVLPFIDLRIALSGPEQFVVSGGVYF
jgi:hypothetical protein